MRYPQLTPIPTQIQTVDAFRGYNHNLRIGAGEFYHMENLRSDLYPVLSPRRKRSLYANSASPQGLIAKEKLCYVDGGDFLLGDIRIPMSLSVRHEDNPKQLVSMGAYVLIFPDKKYINTAAPEDRGSMEAVFTTDGEATLSLCDGNGGELIPTFCQSQVPESPNNGDYWLDISHTPGSLKQWSETAQLWNPVTSCYVRLSYPGIGSAFRRYDGVTLLGLPQLGESAVIRERGEDFLVFTALVQETVTVTDPITICRKLPDMDFVVESGNRLWGCRYGLDESGQMVNRLYASKLGDFRNWSCYMGLSTDSYYVNLGTDGPFTGAISHLGAPLFFKENTLHKVYGSAPAEFSVQDTPCRGVQPGCHGSLAIVGETLYYKSRSGVCAYDGSLPREVSYALGSVRYDSAAAGAFGGKYYISMFDGNGWHLFVYDTLRNQWHREDGLHASHFAAFEEELYAIDAGKNQIIGLLGTGKPMEKSVHWMCQTGELGLSDPQMKYISRITLRLWLEAGAKLEIYAQYDESDVWEHLATIRQCSLRSFSVPIRPRRSDFLRLKFVGEGDGKLYSMTKTIEKGSEIS